MNSQPLPYSRAVVRLDSRRFSHQFAIIGNAASGKSALANRLNSHFGHSLTHLSAGGLMREIGKAQGHGSITDFARHMRENPGQGPDEFVDQKVREHMQRNMRSLDAHLPVFAPHAFIIYLRCPWRVCADRRAVQKGKPASMILTELMQRDRDDQAKYAEIYPGSNWIETDYDFVVDTERNNEEQTFDLVLEAWKQWSAILRSQIASSDLMPVIVPETAPVQ